jgi:hypothetical protein
MKMTGRQSENVREAAGIPLLDMAHSAYGTFNATNLDSLTDYVFGPDVHPLAQPFQAGIDARIGPQPTLADALARLMGLQ